jgi:hypothetical protein
VFAGFGDGKTAEGRAEFFCMGCRSWQDKRFYNCPDCSWSRPGFNKRLRTAQLDNHLFDYANKASQEASMAPVTSDVSFGD